SGGSTRTECTGTALVLVSSSSPAITAPAIKKIFNHFTRSASTTPEESMSTTATAKESSNPKPAAVDMKFEIVVIPVSDIDRAKEFYLKLGWRLDADYATDDKDFRVIQFTPPGSGCSVIFGKRVTAAQPGSSKGLYLIVSDIEAARKELRDRGIDVSEVFHSDGVYAGPDEPYLFGQHRITGPDQNHGS